MNDVEKELQRRQELESRFEKLKEREEELIKMFENSNNYEKQAMTELKTLLYGKNGEIVESGNVLLNGTVLKNKKK